nr:YheC/YheD family protein [Neobacillus sp. Marseille-Q6967]
MEINTIGVLLTKREWNKLKSRKHHVEGIWHLYANKAKELNLNLQFFSLYDVSMESLTTQAIEIRNSLVIKRGTIDLPSIIYNPTRFYKKNNLKKLRELANHPKFQILNEHHIIKKKNLFDLINSYTNRKLNLESENNPYSLLTFYVLGQKSLDKHWNIPVIYVKDTDEKLYTLEEASRLLENHPFNQNTVEEALREISQRFLDLIQFYFPGVYEIGIVYTLKKNGYFYLSTTCSIHSIVKDLFSWNFQLSETVCMSPLKVAMEMIHQRKNSVTLPEDQDSDYIRNDPNENKQSLAHKEDDTNLWVTFKVFHDDEMCLQIPSNLLTKFKSNILQFGIKQQSCKIKLIEEEIDLNQNTYHNPLELWISDSLQLKMPIPTNITYQLKFLGESSIIGPSIGLVLGEKNQLYNPVYMEKYSDRLSVYENFGGLVMAFSTRSIDWEEKIAYGMVYDPHQKQWRYDSAPIPAALYRRNFHQNLEGINQLKELTGGKLFNSHFYKKSDLLQLQSNKEIQHHLPATFLLEKIDELVEFVNVKQKVILKPVSLSRGRGIFILEMNSAEQQGYTLYDLRKEFRLRHLIPDAKGLEEMLKNLKIVNNQYLYQTYIPLLKINNRPFDVRVVMQKYDLNNWKCSGIECRVAGENEVLTNIARGGEAMTLEEVVRQSGLKQTFHMVQENIINLCQTFCQLMDKQVEHYAEFGLDIGLDQDGFPWIIEANIFPSFKGFKTMDYETYLNIRYQPLFYAVRLQGFTVMEGEVDTLNETYHQNNTFF